MAEISSSLSLSLSDKIAFYKKEIENIADTSFNKQQKKLCLDILDKATEENIDKIYQFITQRVKTGFVFDIAPEVQNDCIALIEKDKKLSFTTAELGEKPTHKLIIGENYDALKNLLAVYENKVDFIYIDPPYNTESTRTDGNSLTDIEGQNTGKFIYRDKFSRTGWLNMMNERLQLARKLLSDKGVIFISIDDNEQAYLKVLCDDVFGEKNFVENFIWIKNSTKNLSRTTSTNHEYILCYSKNKSVIEKLEIFRKKKEGLDEVKELIAKAENQNLTKEEVEKQLKELYKQHKDWKGITQYVNVDIIKNEDEFHQVRKYLRVYMLDNTSAPGEPKPERMYDILHPITKQPCKKPVNGWGFKKETMDDLIKNNRIEFYDSHLKVPRIKRYLEDLEDEIIKSVITNYNDGKKELYSIFNEKVFEFPKTITLIKYFLQITDKNAIILDFFAGSGTTGQAVMELNEEDGGKRQFILCTNNENGIAENITYERLYRVINGEGTKGEQIKWQYSKDKKSLKNNNLDVFRVNYHHIEIEDYEKGEQLVKQAKEVFKQLDDNFELKGEFDIYNKLASLKPYSEADRAECEKGFSYQNKKAEEVEDAENEEE